MNIFVSIGIFAIVLFALRDSGYWALVIIPYGALHFYSGIATGAQAVIRQVNAQFKEREA